MPDIRLVTLDPGHFHAALVQKEMYPGVERKVHVYAPLGPDLLAHLTRIASFNTRADQPTAWELEVHAAADFRERVFRDKPGNVVVLAGKNAAKIGYIQAAIAAGMNVLADKPWILVPEDLPKLQAVLEDADRKGLIAYDIMTERYEITSIVQQSLVNDGAVFGEPVPGSQDQPGIYMESVHYLKKTVAGAPLRRPPWFFDVHQQGEGLSDVGTHLVDLAAWILFPGQPVDYRKDVQLVAAKRWPTEVNRTAFQQITGADSFPPALAAAVKGDRLDYFCNTQVSYSVRGVHVKLDVLWDFEAAPGAGDTHLAVFHGTRSRVEVRQGKDEDFRPELYVVPADGNDASVRTAVEQHVSRLRKSFPGVACTQQSGRLHVSIPDHYRTGHEAHFAEVTRQFLRYLEKKEKLPTWEKPNMLAKYFVTTGGVALSRKG
jgi:predicted dehydrogenase